MLGANELLASLAYLNSHDAAHPVPVRAMVQDEAPSSSTATLPCL